MKFLLAICLLACTLGAYADEEIKKEEGVLVLTEKNFDQVTNLTRHFKRQLHHDVDDAFELFNMILFSRPSLTTSSSLLSFTPHGAVIARPSLPSTLRLPASWPKRSLPSSSARLTQLRKANSLRSTKSEDTQPSSSSGI
jgi:hypothetical protein